MSFTTTVLWSVVVGWWIFAGWWAIMSIVWEWLPHSRALKGATPRERKYALLLISLVFLIWPVTLPVVLISGRKHTK